MEKDWISLAKAGQWQELLDSTTLLEKHVDAVSCALWRTRALRALARGDEANSVLLSVVSSDLSAGAVQLAEFAEELIQCAYLEPAAKIVLSLESALKPQADYLWSALWREREDWSRCEEALARTASHGGKWADLARVQEGWTRLAQGNLAESEKLLSPFRGQDHPGLLKLLARLDLACGRLAQAEQGVQKTASMQPLDWEWPPLLAAVRMGSAVAALQAGDETPLKTVKNLFSQGLSRQPRQANALFQRARLHLALKDSKSAVADCNAALACKPWFDAPVLLLVNNHVAVRDYAKASQILAGVRCRFDTPRRAGAALDLMRLAGCKKSELLTTLKPLLDVFGESSVFLRAAGAALQAAKLFDQAAALYNRALRLDPDDNATRNNLAMLYRDRGDHEEAVNEWREIIATGAVDDTLRLNFAHVLIERGDYAEANNFFSQVLSRQPNNPSALRGLAEIHYAAGADDPAWEYARRSLECDAANPQAWKTAAGIQRRKSGERAAISILEQGLRYARPVLPLHDALFARWRGILENKDLRDRLRLWCETAPDEKKYHLMMADAAMDVNDFNGCENALQAVRSLDAGEGGQALIRFYQGRGREGAARRVAEQLVRDEPEVQRNWGLLAEVFYRQQRYEDAFSAVDQGLRIDPTRLALVRQKVGMFLEREQYDKAVEVARNLVEAVPLPPQLALLVEALKRARRDEECVDTLRGWLEKHPKNQVVRFMFCSALRRAGLHEEAFAALEALYSDEPGNYAVAGRYAQALLGLERHDDAVRVVRELSTRLGERPDLLAAICELLREQGELEAARSFSKEALAKYPAHLDLWQQAALLEKRAGDSRAEAACYKEILQRFPARRWAGFALNDLVRLKLVQPMVDALNRWRAEEPDNMAPWWAACTAAKELGEKNKALEILQRIEERRGARVDIYSTRADLLSDRWALSEAIAEVRKAIELQPNSSRLYVQLFGLLVKAGDFDEFDQLMARLDHLLGDRRYSQYGLFFFNINCHPTWSAEQVFHFYREWYRRTVRPSLPAFKPHGNSPSPNRRLRIGYISPDFRRHAVAYFSEPLLMHHDREQFELFAYAHLDHGQRDEYTERFQSYFDHWTEIRGMSDDELERRIRTDQIDILFDLAGHTSNNRLGIMTRRPAPVQASWIWGAGQTTGLYEVDYLLCDALSIPPEHEPYVMEKVQRLPFAGLPFKPAHDILEPTPLPLLENGFVTFGVLARPLRTNRQTIAVWAEILRQVPTAKLRFDHMPYAEPDIQQRFITQFKELGIDPQRLVFRNTRPHWQAYQELDVQLDPFPAGSCTTITEGLWMDRIAITLRSRPPMGRLPESALTALGLEQDCCADTHDEYIAKAVALARHPERIELLSDGLLARVQHSSLTDYAGYGRAAAELYREMWQVWCEQQNEKGKNE